MPVKPAQLTALLAKAIPAGYPILITGAPGIGKSDLVLQAAQAAGANLIVSHPVVSDPTDFKGLPWPAADHSHASFLPFGDFAQALEATNPTVWFLDDLGQASPAVQAACMQLLLARRVNGHILPPCVSFLAATNRRTDRAAVSGILEPVKSRFLSIVELVTDIADWSLWALDHDIHPEVIAFLRFRPELLSAFEPTNDLTNSPTPRTWAHASRVIGMALPADLEYQTLAGAIGEAATTELVGFRRLFAALPSIDGILIDPAAAPIPTEPSALYATVTALACRATKVNCGRIFTYADRLRAEHHAEFAVLLIRDTIRRQPDLQQTADFVRLAAGPFGQLLN